MRALSRRRVSHVALASALALGVTAVVAPAGAVVDPTGTVSTTPAVSVERDPFFVVASNTVGALAQTSGPVLSLLNTTTGTTSPTTVGTFDVGGWLATDTDAVGIRGAGIPAPTSPEVLIRVSLADGTVTTGTEPAGYTTGLLSFVGGTDRAWAFVDLSGAIPSFLLRPFNAGADTTFTPPSGTTSLTPLAVGTAGILFVETHDIDLTTNDTTVSLWKSDGSGVSVVKDFGSNYLGSLPYSAALAGGFAAWYDGDVLSHTAIGGVPTTLAMSSVLPSAPASPLVVLPDAVAWTANDGFEHQWAVSGSAVATAGTTSDRVDRSARTDGTPAFIVTQYSTTPAQYPFAVLVAATTATIVGQFQGALLTLGVMNAAAGAGSLLTELETSDPVTGAADVLVRTIGGSPTALGATSLVVRRSSNANSLRLSRASSYVQGFSISGRRSAIPVWPGLVTAGQELRLFDGASRTGGIAARGIKQISQSGPYSAYVLTGGAAGVALPTGVTIASLPSKPLQVVMDGSRVAYVPFDGSVWVRDVTAPASATNPKRLLPPCATATVECTYRIALSGPKLVASEIRAGLSVGRVRVIDVATGVGVQLPALSGVVDVAISGSTVLAQIDVTTPAQVRLIDTAAASPAWSVFTTTDGYRAGLDGHTVWWVGSSSGLSQDVIKAAPIPAALDHTQHPRVLGEFARFGDALAHNASSAAMRTWSPQFDLTAPLSAWTLTLRNAAGATVRTFSGSTTTSSIRSITWDGKSNGGTTQPAGVYTWTLSGTGAEGSLVAASGAGAAHGRVVVAVQRAAVVAVTPVRTTVPYATTAVITAALRRAGTTAGIAGERLELFSRALRTSAWAPAGFATTDAHGVVRFSVKPGSHWQYQVRHPLTPAASAAASVPSTVSVSFTVTAKSSLVRAKRGALVSVSGLVRPAVLSAPVSVQQLVGSTWKAVTTTKLTATGTYAVAVRLPATAGTYRYRVSKPADATHVTATSSTITIVVV